MLLIEQLLSFLVDYVFIFIYKIPTIVDESSDIIYCLAVLILTKQESSCSWIFFKLAAYILRIEAASAVVEELGEVLAFVHKLALVELLSVVDVAYVALNVSQVATLVDSAPVFVYKFPLLVLLDYRSALFVEVKVASDIVWVEVVFLHTERCWDLSSFIHLFLVKHLLIVLVFDHVACRVFYKVASLINRSPLLVDIVSILILQHNHIALFISVEISKNIVFIESTFLCIRWHLYF